MKDKKGFTLVELLAVIVVLGIIMAIAAGTVTSAINNARKSSFVNSHKMLTKEIKTRIQKNKLGIDVQPITCDDTGVVYSDKCSDTYDISNDDYIMKVVKDSTGNFIFTLQGKGTFQNVDLSAIKNELSISNDNIVESGTGGEMVFQAFNSEAKTITASSEIENIKTDVNATESKIASFAYFDTLKKIITCKAKDSNCNATSLLPDATLFYYTNYTGHCSSGYTASATIAFDTSGIGSEYYDKIDLNFLKEYRELGAKVFDTYGHNDSRTKEKKMITLCYSIDDGIINYYDMKDGQRVNHYEDGNFREITH